MEAIYSEVAIARGSATVPVLGRDSRAGGGVGKLESEKASGVLWLEAVAMGKLEVG